MKKRLCIIFIIFSSFLFSQEIAVLKYNGGGDWYANPTSLPNLAKFCNQNIHTQINTKTAIVEASSGTLSSYPFIHMTGHGNVVFNPTEIINLKNYLLAGGFLHIDDNYGMDEFIRKEIKKYSPIRNYKKSPRTILFLWLLIRFQMVYLKFMNTTINSLKHLGFLLKIAWFYSILTNVI